MLPGYQIKFPDNRISRNNWIMSRRVWSSPPLCAVGRYYVWGDCMAVSLFLIYRKGWTRLTEFIIHFPIKLIKEKFFTTNIQVISVVLVVKILVEITFNSVLKIQKQIHVFIHPAHISGGLSMCKHCLGPDGRYCDKKEFLNDQLYSWLTETWASWIQGIRRKSSQCNKDSYRISSLPFL